MGGETVMERKQIKLTVKERTGLERFSTGGVHSVRLVNRAKIILALDASKGRAAERQEAPAKRLAVSRQTVINGGQTFPAVKNAALFLQRKQREAPPVPPKVTGETEARITALACGKVPEGYARRALRLPADKCAELRYSDAMPHTTISNILKKTNLSLA
jgi:hypothetical protein